MPTYKVTDPQSGNSLKLTGDSPPTEQELEQIFSSVKGTSKMSWGDALTKGVRNLPKSVYEDVLKPAAKMITEPSPFMQDPEHPEKKPLGLMEAGKAIGKDYAQAYGGVENIKRTIAEHPARVGLDVSTVLMPAAKLAQVGGLAKTAGALSTVADITNPIGTAGKVVSGVRKVIGSTGLPESLMARTAKIPPGSLRDTERTKVLKTLVRDEGIPLGKNTVAKMTDTIADLDTTISREINAASRAGADMDVNRISTALDDLKRTYANRPKPQDYYDTIDAVKQDYLNHAFNNQGRISLEDAHALKKGTYAEIQDYYMKQQKPETGRVGIKTDVEAAGKAVAAKTLREEVLNNPAIPDSVKTMMKREAGLMNARKWVERATNRGGNLDPVGLSGMLFSVMVEGGIPGAAAWRIATSQPVMSRIAIGLARGSKTMKVVGEVAKPGTVVAAQAERVLTYDPQTGDFK